MAEGLSRTGPLAAKTEEGLLSLHFSLIVESWPTKKLIAVGQEVQFEEENGI